MASLRKTKKAKLSAPMLTESLDDLMSDDDRAKERALNESKKYCMARWIYKRQNQLTPKGKQTWAQWWFESYQEDYTSYVQNMINQKAA